jgi:membrane-bound metal-dependent hydrolase YbcI (DUF457 family)
MPSPLAHSAVGYVVAKVLMPQSKREGDKRLENNYKLTLAAVFLSLLPDFDAGVGVLLGDFGRYHNNISHSLIFGLVASLLIGLIVKVAHIGQFWTGFFITILCYELHIVMDFFTYGRGIMLLWPFTNQRFQSDILLFYGLHWSDGLFSISHIITLVNEIFFITLLIWVFNRVLNRKHQPKSTVEQMANPGEDRVA